jgi:hypothetical protein
MAHDNFEQEIRVKFDIQAGFPLPEYEKVLRIIGAADTGSAWLQTSTGSTTASVSGGMRLFEGQVANVQDVQIERFGGSHGTATFWVTPDD